MFQVVKIGYLFFLFQKLALVCHILRVDNYALDLDFGRDFNEEFDVHTEVCAQARNEFFQQFIFRY